jgi:hypothetical protein
MSMPNTSAISKVSKKDYPSSPFFCAYFLFVSATFSLNNRIFF